MTINSIKELEIPDLASRNEKDEYNAFTADLYKDDPILNELYNATQIILPYPTDVDIPFITGPWCICDIFGYRYTHGFLCEFSKREKDAFMKKNGLSSNDFGIVTFDDWLAYHCEYHYPYLKPRQDEILKKMKEAYLREDLISTLLAFNIDPRQFWYVLLWIKDYIESQLRNHEILFEPIISSMMNIADAINKEIKQHNQLRNWSKSESKYNLVLKTSDRKVIVNNPGFIKILSDLLTSFIQEANTESIKEKYPFISSDTIYYASEDFCFANIEKKLPLQDSACHKLLLFHEAMMQYFKTKTGVKNKMVSQFILESTSTELASVDKELLITRLAAVIGYIRKVDYENDNKLDNHYVKSRIKGMKKDKAKSIFSNVYHYG